MKLYTVREVAELLGFSRMSVWLWVRFGELKAEKVGERFIISQKNFIKFINLVNIDEADLNQLGQAAVTMAGAEGLEAHARAVEKRLEALG